MKLPSSGEPFRIVVIDDSRSVLTLLTQLVSTVEGCEGIPFLDPLEALDWNRHNEADLIIVDYIMPRMNGLAFVEAFRQLEARGDIPIVMVTGSDDQAVRYMALQEGTTDFVNKPIDNVEFVTRLRNLLVMRQHFKEARERADILRKAKEEVDLAFGQLRLAHDELALTRDNLAEALGIIEGSIEYASRIQRSLLADESTLNQHFADWFILWEPRDVVGGDIYWCCRWGEGILLALGDCTGHGVPGAFMTLIATGAFERARSEINPGNLGGLLARMHQLVQITTKQNSSLGESDDGMELGLCYLVPEAPSLRYTGARFSLFTCTPGEAPVEIKGERRGIGYRKVPFDQCYAEVEVPLRQGMRFYLSSDGLIDQVGDPSRRGFGKNRFLSLIDGFGATPMSLQKEALREALRDHQGAEMRRDDVSVVGFRLREAGT
ncbi:MAG: response regulator [Magnetococcales bacterium]|nr:response regulator [Magnetococcales bacterium]